jgi:uncharacterized membrane protein YbaN (DUF454 family)
MKFKNIIVDILSEDFQNKKLLIFMLSKWFGETIKDFQEKRGMSLKSKITAISMITASISISLYFASNLYVSIFLIVCGVVSISIILSQKTKKETSNE